MSRPHGLALSPRSGYRLAQQREGSQSLQEELEPEENGALYVWFVAMVALLLVVVGLGEAYLLEGAYPLDEASAEDPAAISWRVAQWAMATNLSQATVIIVPFTFLYSLESEIIHRASVVIVGLWFVFYTLLNIFRPGMTTAPALACGVIGWTVYVVAFIVPIVLFQGQPKQGEPAPSLPWARTYAIPLILMGALSGLISRWAPVASLGLLMMMIPFAYWLANKDQDVTLSEWYTTAITFLSVNIPAALNRLTAVLVANLDQTNSLESLVTAVSLAVFLCILYLFLYAFGRRGLPVRHRVVALFPVQVFGDIWLEFLFANARVFSGGFFVLLALQVGLTLLRDTGGYDEAYRVLYNVVLAHRGEPAIPRRGEVVVEWLRIWLQNMISELTAMLLFVGAIAGEEMKREEIGTLTGLVSEDRIALLGGYGVVFLFEAAAHILCFLYLRRQIAIEQERADGHLWPGSDRSTLNAMKVKRVSIAAEADKLVRRHAPYMLGCLLYGATSALAYIRWLRVPYA